MSFKMEGNLKSKFTEGEVIYNLIWEDFILILFEEEESYFVCEAKEEIIKGKCVYSINPKNHYHLPKSEIMGVCKSQIDYSHVDHFLRIINKKAA